MRPAINLPRTLDLTAVGRYVGIYVILVFYSAVYEYYFSAQLAPIFVAGTYADFTAYDITKEHIYALLIFLTPLSLLPLGTHLRVAGQYIVGLLAIIIFIPTPIVFVAMVPRFEFWQIYALLWISYFSISCLSALAVDVRFPAATRKNFNYFLIVFYTLYGIGLLFIVATNRTSLVAFDKIYAERSAVTASGIEQYLIAAYMASFGALLVVIAIRVRRVYIIPLAICGFVACYAVMAEREAILMPCWLIYMYIMSRVFYKESLARYLIAVMLPFLVGVVGVELIGTEDRQSLMIVGFMLANYRLFTIPAISFNVYYNFFAEHAFTYWSHIGLVGKFVPYPYLQPISLVMQDAYRMGNYNASFIETDALAAAGVNSLPFVSIVFGLIIVAVNTCTRRLSPRFLAMISAGPALEFVNVGIGPALLTGGLGLMSLLLAFAPGDWFLDSQPPSDT